MDPKIKESCNVSSVWKVVDIAMSCIAYDSAKRPKMNHVVGELNECLSLEVNQGGGYQVDSTTSNSPNFNSDYAPLAR